jgi:F5/8 type C domain
MDRARWLSSSQVSSWIGTGDVKVPSRQVSGFAVAWSVNGYNGLINQIGTALGAELGQGYINPDSTAPAGTANKPAGTVTGYQVTSSQSSNIDAYRLSYRAFDHVVTANGNTATGGEAHTSTQANPWWKVDFGLKTIRLDRFGTIARTDPTYLTGNFLVQGSNDNTNWTTLLTIAATVPQGTWNSWQVTDPTRFRYIRVYQNGSTYLTIGDIEFWGQVS